ncbi:MAG TPA: HAMP domain-containing sensor histidine kinase [Gaiellaceae bacterium]
MEIAWVVFAAANLWAMARWQSWETVPFHFIWVSLTLLYGFRTWRPVPTLAALGCVVFSTAILIRVDIANGTQQWGELFEVPLMSAMFLAMVWHARRRQQAMRAVEQLAADRAALLERQERFLHDASHELRTPVTIARGHLEVLERVEREAAPEIAVALDELARIERIVERLLLLAKAGEEGFLDLEEIDVEPFVEDVFMRWSEVAPRAWRLGRLVGGTVRADRESLRIAFDALLENAVKYTEPADSIELEARGRDGALELRVADSGRGVAAEALDWIFERFSRADPARSRADGGVGLGLAIVDAIARAHGGSCTVETPASGAVFVLRLPGFLAAPARRPVLQERA